MPAKATKTPEATGDPSGRPTKAEQSLPTFVLVVFAIFLLPVGVTLTWYSGVGAYDDFQMAKAEGTVVAVRIQKIVPRPPRGGDYQKDLLVRYHDTLGRTEHWLPKHRLRDPEAVDLEADKGKIVSVWYHASEGTGATLSPPDPLRKTFSALWSSIFAFAGLVSISVLYRRYRSASS